MGNMGKGKGDKGIRVGNTGKGEGNMAMREGNVRSKANIEMGNMVGEENGGWCGGGEQGNGGWGHVEGGYEKVVRVGNMWIEVLEEGNMGKGKGGRECRTCGCGIQYYPELFD